MHAPDNYFAAPAYAHADWQYPPAFPDEGGSEKPGIWQLPGNGEVRVSFTVAGGKIAYDIPVAVPGQPGANRALVE